MSEQVGGGAEIPAIELPSALRIRQRLGHVSTERAFKQHFVPRAQELSHLEVTPQELIESLETRLADYAEEHVLGMVPFTLERFMPRVINQLVDDEQQKKSTLKAWEERVAELKGE